jgi:redox-sensitive bicupin YhaK (pirin superfamily)
MMVIRRSKERGHAGKGFGAHSYLDREIIHDVVSGKLGLKGNMRHQEVLNPKVVRVMSAGSGVVHSESNASESEPIQFRQLWIEPAEKGLPSNGQQLAFEAAQRVVLWKKLVIPERLAGVEGPVNHGPMIFSRGNKP